MNKSVIILFLLVSNLLVGQVGEWTWMHGDSTVNSNGSFGSQGVYSPTNSPPAFYEACEWKDQQGNFWLYGGNSWGNGEFADLWKFNPSINQWMWVKGSGLPNQAPVYGTQGVPSPSNTPGSRAWGIATWVDTVGNFWLYGGARGSSCFGDLWRYNITTNEWTWMKGPQNFSLQHSCGIKGVSDPSNEPWKKAETNCTWTDNNNL